MFQRTTYILVAATCIIALVILVAVRQSTPQEKFHFIDDGKVSPNGGEYTAEYTRISSIGDVAADLLQKRGIKESVSTRDLAQLIVDSHSTSLFPPGVVYRVSPDGFLVDTRNNQRYEVDSDGSKVTVMKQPDGKAIQVPIQENAKSE